MLSQVLDSVGDLLCERVHFFQVNVTSDLIGGRTANQSTYASSLIGWNCGTIVARVKLSAQRIGGRRGLRERGREEVSECIGLSVP